MVGCGTVWKYVIRKVMMIRLDRLNRGDVAWVLGRREGVGHIYWPPSAKIDLDVRGKRWR